MLFVFSQTASCRSAPVPSRMIRSMCAISRFAAEFVDFGRNEFEQFIDQAAGLDFSLSAEIDQFAVNAIARGPPAIFIEQAAAINTEGRISAEQFVELGDQSPESTPQSRACHRRAIERRIPATRACRKRDAVECPTRFFSDCRCNRF